MDILRRDVRSALAAMRRAPGFAATALVTLALGIGATTAVFSVTVAGIARGVNRSGVDAARTIDADHADGSERCDSRSVVLRSLLGQ